MTILEPLYSKKRRNRLSSEEPTTSRQHRRSFVRNIACEFFRCPISSKTIFLLCRVVDAQDMRTSHRVLSWLFVMMIWTIKPRVFFIVMFADDDRLSLRSSSNSHTNDDDPMYTRKRLKLITSFGKCVCLSDRLLWRIDQTDMDRASAFVNNSIHGTDTVENICTLWEGVRRQTVKFTTAESNGLPNKKGKKVIWNHGLVAISETSFIQGELFT